MTGPGATEGSSVGTDLATLREALAIGWPEGDHAEPHVFTEALDALARVRDSLERLQSLWLAERELRLTEQAAHRQTNEEAEALAEELERLQEPRDETGYPAWSGLPNDPLVRFTSASWHCPVCDRRGDVHDERCLVLELVTVARRRKDGNRRLVETNGRLRETAEAAEARCARLQQALAGLESAVRILDVMLHEPAAEGLMSAEDYRSYVQGAWLGVDEAAEKAREALAGPDTPADSQEDKT